MRFRKNYTRVCRIDIDENTLSFSESYGAAYNKDLVARLKNWIPDILGTLVFVIDLPWVLLIQKKTGHGAGKINGPGGKVHVGENPRDCALREVQEEVGLTVDGLELVAELKFVDKSWPDWLGYVYVASSFSGAIHETEEAKPFWCHIQEISYDSMWESDRYWLPHVLREKASQGQNIERKIQGEFLLDAGELLAHRCYAQELV
tara:strand:+ start:88 stop:699 length:612 start_codon:yes stop_codon:yes gene_type:complete